MNPAAPHTRACLRFLFLFASRQMCFRTLEERRAFYGFMNCSRAFSSAALNDARTRM